jgi:hypothetical protein
VHRLVISNSRTQADRGGLDDGLDELDAAVAELVGELDDEDAVLAGDSDRHDAADLAEDVDRGVERPEAEQRAR